MALGFKNFVSGAVFSESDVDGIMRQTVMNFASTSARDTALSGVLEEGLTTFQRDTNSYTYYDGSAWKTLVGASTAWTPVLTAATTNPTLGTGSSSVGRYVQVGDMVTVWGRIAFGTSGASAGSGVYYISLPVSANTSTLTASTNSGAGQSIGSGHIYDASAVSQSAPISAQLRTADLMQFLAGAAGALTNSNPVTFTNDDVITFNVTYLAA